MRFNRKQAFYTCIQIMEVLKFGHSKKKKSTKVLSCLDLLLEEDILIFFLSLSGMLQTAKRLQEVEHWHTVLSQKKFLCNSFSSTDCHTISAPQRGESWNRRSYRRYQYKIYPKKYIFSNFSKGCIFIKKALLCETIYLPE